MLVCLCLATTWKGGWGGRDAGGGSLNAGAGGSRRVIGEKRGDRMGDVVGSLVGGTSREIARPSSLAVGSKRLAELSRRSVQFGSARPTRRKGIFSTCDSV